VSGERRITCCGIAVSCVEDEAVPFLGIHTEAVKCGELARNESVAHVNHFGADSAT
jgi:hypothetical protein